MFGIPGCLFWLIAVAALVLLESATMALTCIWFAVGAVGALAVSLLGGGFWPQMIVFVLLSALCLAAVRPVAVRRLGIKKTATNADRVLQSRGVVVETIDNGIPSGQVRAAGQIWTARAADDQVIPKGETVVVLQIQGVKLIVEPLPVPAESRS